tara:strand:- start:9 stop:212 length:204 start_codon:yes stop_codon:yes gene_type:complete
MPILGQEKKSTLSQGGVTQNNVAELIVSKLHKDYSITGNPNITGKPAPSSLDLNGATPTKYTDNLPG